MDAAKRKSEQALFRRAAVKAVAQRIFGGVAVAVPPSGKAALLIAMMTLGGLITIACIVEVPQRTRAVGVLMPVGGMLEVVAMRAGQVEDVFVSVGQVVDKDQALFTISDAAHRRGESAPDLRIRSLRAELGLLAEAYISQRDISAQALVRLREEVVTASTQLSIAKKRFAAYGRQLDLLESRFLRWQALLRDGHVSRDAFDLEHANVVGAKAEGTEIQQRMATYSQAIKTLEGSQSETQQQLELIELQHALDVERLQRAIDLAQQEVAQNITATARSVIARVHVRPGEAVRSGQVLASLRRPGDRLQAWLYLPTSTARQLGVGQSVEIMLEAWPHPVYGTHTAIVSSVSTTALLPADIRAPLLVAGPVFEVKAELIDNSINADGQNWPLAPGTSFTAEIIRQRMKLYQWIFRSLRNENGPHNG